MRAAVVAVIGLAALVVVGIAAVLLSDRGPSSAAPPPAVTAGPEPAVTAALLVPVTVASVAAPEPEPVHAPPAAAIAQRGIARSAAPRPPAPGAPPWESVDLAMRPAALGPELAAPVSDGLAEARDAIQFCFDEEARRARGARAPRAAPGAQGPAVLILRLEASPGRLYVAGTEVASTGTSSRQLVDCCRKALEAFDFPAPAAKPPERYKVSLTLM